MTAMTRGNYNQNGALWVASNMTYVEEAILANKKFSQTNPDLPTALVTSESDPGGFDYCIQANLGRQSYGDKITGMQLSPFDNTLFLDTDCYVLSNVSNIFELMQKYDICCRIAPVKSKKLAEKSPQIYPELQTGVILFNRSLNESDIFVKWGEYYDEFNIENDQASFSHTLHNSDVYIGIISPEYNYTIQPQVAYGDIKILHARLTDLGLKPNLRNINKLESKINKYSHLRVTRRYPIRKIKFDYVQVRGEFNSLYQFLFSVWFNGVLYTLEHSRRHFYNWLSNIMSNN
jgi:hypothetical protein